MPPLTPDSLSPDEGHAEERIGDRIGDVEGQERMRIAAESGMVGEYDRDVKEIVEEEQEGASDEERRVREENTINELKSKTGKRFVRDR